MRWFETGDYISEIREEMKDQIRKYLYLPNPPEYNLHLNQFAGAGKTTIVLEELDATDQLFIYLANTHNIASEQITKNSAIYNLLQIESRRRLCKHKEYKLLADNGINIKYFCTECQYISVCEYYQRIIEIWNEPQSWIGVHHHLGGLVNAYVKENGVDVVVIDEYFVNNIFKHLMVFYSHIVQTINLAGRMNDSPERALLFDFLHEFAFSLQNKVVNNIFLYSQIYWYFHNSVREEKEGKLLNFANEYEEKLANYYFVNGKIFRNIVTPIFEAVIDINRRYVPITQPNHLDYIDNVIKVTHGDKHRYVDICRYDLDSLDMDCKIMVLDATTPTTFYKKIFPRDIKTIEKQVPINSTIYQLNTAKFVMQTLDKNAKTRHRLVNIVDLIQKKHNDKILVLSRHKYEDEIKLVNPDMITTDHYPVVGSNDYENLNVIVAFGTPEPRRDMIERQSKLLRIDPEVLLYIQRETFIIQGIHRIRISLKHDIPTYIYLLTNLPLPFRNIKHITIGKLEKLLRNEGEGYITEDNEDRIREDIMKVLENEDMMLSDVLNKIKGNNVVVSEVLKRLISEDMIETYKGVNVSVGRKPIMCRIKE